MKENKVLLDIWQENKHLRIFKEPIAKVGAYSLGNVIKETHLPLKPQEYNFLRKLKR